MTRPQLIVAIGKGVLDTEPTQSARMRLLKQLATEIDKARAIAGEQPFVSRCAQRINLHPLDVNLESSCRLRRIDDQRVTAFDIPETLRIDSETVRVLHVTQRNHAGIRSHGALDIFNANFAVGRR